MADFVFSDPGGRSYVRITAAHPDASRRYSVLAVHHFQTSADGVRDLAKAMLEWIDVEDPSEQIELPLDPLPPPPPRRKQAGQADGR